MASASKTPNLDLPQWVAEEKPERTDFNAAFLAIDGAVQDNADDIAGIVAAVPACQVYRSSAQSIPTAELTTVTLNAIRYDPYNMFASPKITITKPGVYAISANMQFASNATGIRSLRILLNGSTILGMSQTPASSGATTVITASTINNLAAGDYIELSAYQTSGGNLDVQYTAAVSPNLSVARIG